MSNTAASPQEAAKRTYIIVGIAAAATAAAATAYVFWKRSHVLSPQSETVQQLLDRCHTQIRSIEHRLSDLTSSTA